MEPPRATCAACRPIGRGGFSPGRRRAFRVVLPLAGVAFCARALAADAPAPDAARARHIARAFEMRRRAIERGDQPYGAVVVRADEVVGDGVSAVLTTPDPTAHAEMQAIRDAARRLGTARLVGAELYSTSRPCPMCEAAAYWAGIVRMYYGDAVLDAGAPRL